MPLKKSDGNMYPWVTHTHSHLGGKCPHGCSYCYVQAMAKRFPNMRERYSGPVRIMPGEILVKYGAGGTIFVEHMNDLFAEAVEATDILAILGHCGAWPGNSYVFQTKNPRRIMGFLDMLPRQIMVGTTIESDRVPKSILQGAPTAWQRYTAMTRLARDEGVKVFVTVEPILDFNVGTLGDMIESIGPAFVNIGADSKGTGLPEPPREKVMDLIKRLDIAGIEIRRKSNLERLIA